MPQLFLLPSICAVDPSNREMAAPTMESTVAALVAFGKGILAADESFPTIEKRFGSLNISVPDDNRQQAGVEVVAAAVPGILFLSGGQSDEVAPQGLSVICRAGNVPWKLSFSFGRALQSPAMKIWQGFPDNVAASQAALPSRSIQ